MDRALKWHIVLHFLFFRATRGCERGTAAVHALFDAWDRGDYERLFDTFMADVAKGDRRGPRPAPSSTVAHALTLVRPGELSHATHLLTNLGIANAHNPPS
ncbi:MAG: hypothetical protein AAGA68_27455 [Pseudomonadota bacterium]